MNLPDSLQSNATFAQSLAQSCDNCNMTLTFIVENVVGVVGCSVCGGGVVEVSEEALSRVVDGEEGAGRGRRVVRVAERGAVLIGVERWSRQFLT